jgi:hypothetical protein
VVNPEWDKMEEGQDWLAAMYELHDVAMGGQKPGELYSDYLIRLARARQQCEEANKTLLEAEEAHGLGQSQG